MCSPAPSSCSMYKLIILALLLVAPLVLGTTTEMPTSMPSAAPSMQPSAALPDTPVGASVIIFAFSLSYEGINLATWNSSVPANSASVCAATTFTLQIPKSSCTVTSVADTSTRRMLFGGRALTASNPSVSVTTTISAPSSTTYSTYMSRVNTAVASGAFQQAVRTAAAANGATQLMAITVPTSQTATAVSGPVSSSATAVPTLQPSAAPTDATSGTNSSSSSNSATSPGAIVGYVLAGLVVVAALVYLLAPNVYGLPNHDFTGSGSGDAASADLGAAKGARKDSASQYQNIL